MNTARFGFLWFTTAAVSVAWAQPAATPNARLDNSPRHHEWVKIKQGAREVETFIAFPERRDKALTVIVIHENRGLNDWARTVADKLAEHGYVAVAPDLLSGTAPNGGNTRDFAAPGDATRAIGQLPPEQVIADLNAVADYAKALPASNGRLAVIGFCWGGGKTWNFASARSDIVVACPFYGTTPSDSAEYARIACPVHGFYAGNDERVNGTLDRAKSAMQAAGKTFELVLYEGAGHAYMRSGEAADADPANKKAMEESWQRLLRVLAQAANPAQR